MECYEAIRWGEWLKVRNGTDSECLQSWANEWQQCTCKKWIGPRPTYKLYINLI